jgi:hypothetical protein
MATTKVKSLPKLTTPIFELVLPSTGETIRYKPFTVKEEKILLIAQESNDLNQALLSVKQIVNNCMINKKIEELSMFDLEYVLLSIRSKSVENIAKFTIKDNETDESIELELDLTQVQVNIPQDHSKEIRINDDYVLFMRYPTIDEFSLILKNGLSDLQTNYDIMLACMDKLVSVDEVYLFEEFTKEQKEEFVDGLAGKSLAQIKQFFETMPKLRHEMKYTNKAGKEKTFVIEGFNSFFT